MYWERARDKRGGGSGDEGREKLFDARKTNKGHPHFKLNLPNSLPGKLLVLAGHKLHNLVLELGWTAARLNECVRKSAAECSMRLVAPLRFLCDSRHFDRCLSNRVGFVGR